MDKKFLQYLYSRHSIPSMIRHYAEDRFLESDLSILERMKLNRFLTYRQYLVDMEFKDNLVLLFEDIFREISKKTSIHFDLVGRQKSLFSTINKLEQLEESTLETLKKKFISQVMFKDEFENLPENDVIKRECFFREKLTLMENNEQFQDEFSANMRKKSFVGSSDPFERIRDFYGFRIIIEDSFASEHIDDLYMVANMIIEYFTSRGFDVIRHDKLLETNNGLKVCHPNIFVPEKSGIEPRYRSFVKDYVVEPKSLGYQSIHIIFLEPISGKMFEIQLRTDSMEIVANSIAAHSNYKKSKYGSQQAEQELIEFEKIHVPSFRYEAYPDPSDNSKTLVYIYDKAGITQYLDLISKSKRY